MPNVKGDPIWGATVVRVRPMTAAELTREGWEARKWDRPLAIELSSGALLYASQDDEGNGPGALFAWTPKQGTVRFYLE